MGWVKMKLGDVLKNREGRYKPNEITIAGLKRIDKINFSGQIFLSDKGSNTDMILIKKGDLIISGINVEKGALAVYEGEDDILATIHYSSYIFDTAKIDIDFLKVFLRSPDFIQLLKEQVPGGIKTEIKPKHILPLEVYFPETTTEQKVIAEHFFEKEAKFNQLDEHISYQLTQLENLNQAILQEAVQGKLVPQDPKDEPASELLKRIKAEKAKSGKKEKPLPPIKPEEIPFEIPENWVWCRLGEICEIKGGKRVRNGYKLLRKPTEHIYIRVTDMKNGSISNNDIHYIDDKMFEAIKQYTISKYDLYITIAGTIGEVGEVPEMFDGANLTENAAKFVFNNELISRSWLRNILSSKHSQLQFLDKTKKVTAQPKLALTRIATTLIPFPPLSEQKSIVAEIEKQLAKTKQLKEHIIANQQATEKLLKALLHQAFEVKVN